MKKFLYYIMPFIVTPAIKTMCEVFYNWGLLPYSLYAIGGVLLIVSALFGFFTSTNKKFDYLMTFIMPISFFVSMFFTGFFGRGEQGIWYNIDCARLLAYQPFALISYCLMAVVTFIASYKGFRKFKNRITQKIKTDGGKTTTFKISSIIATALGSIILIFSIVVPIIMLIFGSNQDKASIAIIGGADASTTVSLFWTMMFTGDSFSRILFGLTLLLVGVLSLIFRKSIFANCTLKTTALTLLTSFFTALVLISLIVWSGNAPWSNSIYFCPIEYPASIVLGMLSLLSIITLIVSYVKERKRNLYIKGLVIDILTTVITLPCFFVICLSVYECLYNGYLPG